MNPESASPSAPRRRLNILVIDDEPAMRDLIQLALDYDGHRTLVAGSGEDGQAIARRMQPDIIICDVNMPGISGHEVLQALQAEAETRHIPFIFLTGCREAESIRLGMAGGASEYLTKPFRPEELTEAVTACARKLVWLDEAPGTSRPSADSG